MFSVGGTLPGSRGGVVVGVRRHGDEVVPLVRWEGDERLYGIPIDVSDRRRDFHYDRPVEDDEEWVESVGIGFMVMLDTGFRARARRRLADGYIELRKSGGWPVDRRFYLSRFDEGFDDGRAAWLRDDGLDPDPALTALASGRLIAWLVAYENNATGSPDVGQAVVVGDASGAVRLDLLETAPGVPQSVLLDLAYFAAHAAAERGAESVVSNSTDPVLRIAGFEDRGDQRVLDTSFLAADPEEARALLDRSLAEGGRWGEDRDAAGRYLPRSAPGRLIHRLVRGPGGRRPRVWVG